MVSAGLDGHRVRRVAGHPVLTGIVRRTKTKADIPLHPPGNAIAKPVQTDVGLNTAIISKNPAQCKRFFQDARHFFFHARPSRWLVSDSPRNADICFSAVVFMPERRKFSISSAFTSAEIYDKLRRLNMAYHVLPPAGLVLGLIARAFRGAPPARNSAPWDIFRKVESS